MKFFPFFQQPDAMDCGPTCLRMIAKYYGKSVSLPQLRILSDTTREGSSLQNIANAAEKLGFRTLGVKVSLEQLVLDAPLPCILHWNSSHFVVLYKVKKEVYYIADPGHGLIKLTQKEVLENWISLSATAQTQEGIALLLEPTSAFTTEEVGKDTRDIQKGFSFLSHYILKYKKQLFQLALGLLVGSLLQLIFPFLTQSVVDIGIQTNNLPFIYLVLIAQLFLFFGQSAIEIIRSWILLHLSTRINISLVSDFFVKLMNLPIAFFDTKMTGDILQRINDHHRIESLLTGTSLNALFSFFNIIVLGGVLAWYDIRIFLIFFVFSLLYCLWVAVFLKKRKDLDYKRFSQVSSEQSKVIEIISGMQEIKLHNAEMQKRWEWEHLQIKLFKVSIKSLSLEQVQSIGASIINELKNILITILAAQLVIQGKITLGIMLAISYIIGQLNGPIQQIIGFVYAWQDAKIALERLSEIHNKENEEELDSFRTSHFNKQGDIVLDNVSFQYQGSNKSVLENLTLTIPGNKVTAIVGASGSGKTTLMKMLLKFYEPNEGNIKIEHTDMQLISHKAWRGICGSVMQDGYIFNDTIANNITIGEANVNYEQLVKATQVANIYDFISELPLGFNTKIGMEGVGVSAGQKQRILIARAVYKNPNIIFFDEATSALDAENERIIMENLGQFMKQRTSIVIAHRLSTVKNADQIVVLDKGRIIEKGNHQALIQLQGAYYNLVKNQLDLENLAK